jgi:lipoyl-dependent peroxiredoxin
MATTRNARAHWEGTLLEGSGTVELTSSGIGTYPITWASRAESPDGRTSPEELIAAAHSACYAMSLTSAVANAGGTPQSLDVTATVTLGADADKGGFAITGIKLVVEGEVEGLDEAGFAKAAQTAKEGCPVSKALAGTTITLEASLA